MRDWIGILCPRSASIGIIGGADGPTAVYLSGKIPWALCSLLFVRRASDKTAAYCV